MQAVDRATQLLLLLADRRGPLGVRELGRRAALHPSTVSRLLATLERSHLVVRTGDGDYALGLAAARLARAVDVDALLRGVCRPFLVRLRDATGETANLLLAEGGDARYVDQVESAHALRHAPFLGRRIPLVGTAVGAALDDPGRGHAVEGGAEEGVLAIACALPPEAGLEAALSVTGPASRISPAARLAAAAALEEAVRGLVSLLRQGPAHVR